jgi:hypothetical protein
MPNNIDPYTGIRRKCFALWKNQFYSLTYEEIGKPIDEGTTKTAYTLKNHPDLLFLQLNENLEESNYIFENHQYSNLNVVQIAVINSELLVKF